MKTENEMLVEQQQNLIHELKATTAELLDALEGMARARTVELNFQHVVSSLYMKDVADALRLLEKYKRFRITSLGSDEREVRGFWPEHDPEKGKKKCSK